MITPEQLEGVQEITWCTGCGNFGIHAALRKALVELDVPHHELFMVSGIGCSGKISHYVNVNSIHTLHGRPIPYATGAHIANPDLKIFVHTGDGDCLGEGLGHFIHAARRNVNIAVFMHNNGVNGLTKGQFSPAAPRGYVSKTSPAPKGAPMDPVNALSLAIVAGATFVARGFSGQQKELVELMKDAIKHKGFAFIDILQPCVTWNKELTWKFFNERIYSLSDSNHDVNDKVEAIRKAMEWERIPLGLLYKEDKPDLASGLALPLDERLRDHITNKEKLQDILDNYRI